MKRIFSLVALAAVMCCTLAVSAQAVDYSFATGASNDYYDPTAYEDVYGSGYNYGGPNVVDYQIPELEYGSFSTTQTGVMEKAVLPGLQQNSYTAGGSGGYGISDSSGDGITTILPGVSDTAGGTVLPGLTQFTDLHDIQLLSNGAIGRISIPALKIKNYYVWEGTTSASMKKGIGHFANTSVWGGNTCLAGHNRGARYVIGGIKDLEPGDEITYTTSLGTRTYEVETVVKISNNDWSYLEATSDNRITLVTCVAGDSSHRWCVQAIEVS